MNKTKNKKGFTLVELVVVIAIIAILSAILVPTFTGYKRSNMIKVANGNAYQVYMAVQNWLNDMDTRDIMIAENSAGSEPRPYYTSTYDKTTNFIILSSGNNSAGTYVYDLVCDHPANVDNGWKVSSKLSEIDRNIAKYLVTSDINKKDEQTWLAKVDLATYTVEYALWLSEARTFTDESQRNKEQLATFIDSEGNVSLGCYPMVGQVS